MKPPILALCIVFLAYSHTYAAGSDGNSLLDKCSAAITFMNSNQMENIRETFKTGLCLGFMQGIIQTSLIHQWNYRITQKHPVMFCLPEDGITNGQATRIIIKYLKNHSEKLHKPAIHLSHSAFIAAFPCPIKKP